LNTLGTSAVLSSPLGDAYRGYSHSVVLGANRGVVARTEPRSADTRCELARDCLSALPVCLPRKSAHAGPNGVGYVNGVRAVNRGEKKVAA